MSAQLPADRLLAVIQTQNEIAATALDLDRVMALVVERARDVIGAAAAVVELVDGDEMVYHVTSGTAAEYVGLRLRAASSLSGLCVSEGRILHCVDAQTDDRVDREACVRVGAVSMACVPLTYNGRVVGVLKVYDPRPHAFTNEDIATLDLLTGVIAAHMAHASDFEEQLHASRHDALTGLANRRAFDERLGREVAKVRRHGGQLTVCVLDLDRFKYVNDTHGHAAGDSVLRAVAASILSSVRGEDGAYRLGGDEFALVLVEADPDGAELVAQRIAELIVADPEAMGVGASWGIATLKPGEDAAGVLARADAELYRSKTRLPSVR